MASGDPPLRILYLENSESDTHPALAALTSAGFTPAVQFVSTRAEFENAFTALPVDLILSAEQLPGWTGLEALRLLRQHHRELPFVFVTGPIDADTAVGLLRQGASDHVLKSRLGRLAPAVARVLNTRKLRAEQRRARRALAESERRFRCFALGTSDLLWIADRTGRLKGSLARWQRYTGKRDEELAGYGWLDAIHPDDRGPLRRRLEEASASGSPFERELRIRRADGAFRLFVFKAVPVTSVIDGTLLEWIAGARDVTDRAAAESAGREGERRLLQAQRLELVGQFAGGIAHDFNNILTSILGFSQILLDQLPADSPARGDAEEIYRAGELASALTRKLLAFSRRQPINPQVVDLNRAVEDVRDLLGRLLGEEIRLDLELRARPALVRADPGQLQQVVFNLAVNARDAMPRGGRLRIRTSTTTLAPGPLPSGPVIPAGRYQVLTVVDEGTGMAPEVLERVFEPFFTTKGGNRGSGLGLSTVYGIVQQAGGQIVVQSTEGRGSTFEVYLPAAEAEGPAPAVSRPRGAAPGETILVVEDEPAIRSLAERVLRRAGYSVQSAESAAAARAQAAGTDPIHLVLMDIMLPDERGTRIVGELRALQPRTRFVFISGNLSVGDEELLPPGSQWFLPKPFSPDQLLNAVRFALDAPSEAPVAPQPGPS